MFDSLLSWVLFGYVVFCVVSMYLLATVFYLLYRRHEQARMDWEKNTK